MIGSLKREEHTYFIINKGISTNEVGSLCSILNIHNRRSTSSYIEVWLTDDHQLKKLADILDILKVDYQIARDISL